MSLTSMIANRNSTLNDIFNDLGLREKAQNFIDTHNNELSRITPLATPYWKSSDHARTGTAMIYVIALLRKSKHLIHLVNRPVAEFAETLPIEYGALLLALVEQNYRSGVSVKLSSGAAQLPSGKPLVDKSDAIAYPKLQATVAEIKALIPNCQTLLDMEANTQQWDFHETFSGSLMFGGADANLIIDNNTLIDIRTTRKRKPLTADTFLQQIMYAYMANVDSKPVSKIGFFYVRHGMYLEYESDMQPLVKRLESGLEPGHYYDNYGNKVYDLFDEGEWDGFGYEDDYYGYSDPMDIIDFD